MQQSLSFCTQLLDHDRMSPTAHGNPYRTRLAFLLLMIHFSICLVHGRDYLYIKRDIFCGVRLPSTQAGAKLILSCCAQPLPHMLGALCLFRLRDLPLMKSCQLPSTHSQPTSCHGRLMLVFGLAQGANSYKPPVKIFPFQIYML